VFERLVTRLKNLLRLISQVFQVFQVSSEPALIHLLDQSIRCVASGDRHCNCPIGCIGFEFYIGCGADPDCNEDRHDVPVSERNTTLIQGVTAVGSGF
jgi:hypothetical protein